MVLTTAVVASTAVPLRRSKRLNKVQKKHTPVMAAPQKDDIQDTYVSGHTLLSFYGGDSGCPN